jgi:hypothetical protein
MGIQLNLLDSVDAEVGVTRVARNSTVQPDSLLTEGLRKTGTLKGRPHPVGILTGGTSSDRLQLHPCQGWVGVGAFFPSPSIN